MKYIFTMVNCDKKLKQKASLNYFKDINFGGEVEMIESETKSIHETSIKSVVVDGNQSWTRLIVDRDKPVNSVHVPDTQGYSGLVSEQHTSTHKTYELGGPHNFSDFSGGRI